MTSTSSPARSRLIAPLLIAVLLGLVLLWTPAWVPTGAGAATPGKMITFGGWSIGAFLSSSGRYVYCIEPGSADPIGAQKSAKLLTSLPGYQASTFDQTGWNGKVTSGSLSGKRLRQINYVLWQHGRTQSSTKAATVQLAVWMLRDDPGAAKWLDHHLDWIAQHGGQARIDDAKALVIEARAKAVVAVAPKPAPLKVESNPDESAGTVSYPAGTTRLTIAGGRFANDTQKLTIAGGKAGTAAWVATPFAEDWQQASEVVISAQWTRTATGWPAKVRVYPPVVLQQQRLAAGVGATRSSFSGALSTEISMEANFQPVLSSRVEARFLEAGEDRFSDMLEFEVAEGSDPWPSKVGPNQEVEYAPIVATGTVYGPFDRPQRQRATIPKGAPVAGDATITADRGPGEYAVESATIAKSPGYYYWVWQIESTAQPTTLLPTNYAFRDDFGLAEESHVVPTSLRWSTALLERQLTIGERELRDQISATIRTGSWLRDASGARIPARIRLSVYQSEHEPARRARSPQGAEPVASVLVDLVGDSSNRAQAISPTITLPARVRGWVTVQACLREADQPKQWRGYVEEWCDDYGVPAETARIIEPAPSVPATPDAPDGSPRLAETGADGAFGAQSASLLGAGLISSGLGAMVLSRRGRRKRVRSSYVDLAQRGVGR